MGAAPARRSAWRPRLGFVVWCGLVVATTIMVTRSGAGMLSPPPLDPGAWMGWLAGSDPFVAVMALLRTVVVGLLWYLTAATLFGTLVRIGAAGQLRGTRGLVRAMDIVTPALLRRLLEGAFGASVATALVAAPIMVPHAAAQPPIPVVFGDADLPEADDAPLVPRGAPWPEPPSAPGDAGVAADTSSDPDSRQMANEYFVAGGESFWSIACDVVAAGLDRHPSDAEVAPYWRRLVDANRGRLADADNPDLIFPDQILILPPP